MLPEPDRVRLLHMLDVTREARSFVEGRTRADLDGDAMLLRALVNCLQVFGEAASQVTWETRGRIAGIPWRSIIGMRNRLVHAYFDIDKDVVWATVSNNLPGLEVTLSEVLNEERRAEGGLSDLFRGGLR